MGNFLISLGRVSFSGRFGSMELVSCVICRLKSLICYSSLDDVMETD